MSNNIQITIDQQDVDRKLKKLKNIQNGAPRAMTRAMNRTVSGMKTDAWNLAKSHYTIKNKKDFNDKIKIEKATMNDLSIALRSTGRPMRGVKFKYKKNRSPKAKGREYFGRSFRRAERSHNRGPDKGPRKKYKAGSGGWNRGSTPVFLHVKKGKSGNLIKSPSGFMANFTPGKDSSAADNSLSGIFTRTGRAKTRVQKGRYKGQLREPIRQVYSPGSVQMLDSTDIQQPLREKATERFNKELDHQVKFLLDQQKG